MKTVDVNKIDMKSTASGYLISVDDTLLGSITDFKISRVGQRAITIELIQNINEEIHYILKSGQYNLTAIAPETNPWR